MRYLQTELHNCHAITEGADGSGRKMIRVPEWVRNSMGQIGKTYTAYNTPNTEIRFCMKSDSVTLRFQIFHPEGSSYADQVLEVYFGCFQDDALRILDDSHCEITVKKPENMELLKSLAQKEHMSFSPEVVRILAPGDCHLMLLSVKGEVMPPAAEQLPAKTWLAYGSSITQGSNGLHPAGSYASIAAAKLGVDLLNFGFGGSALLEPEMADYLASRTDFDWISLEMGINMIWDIGENRPGDPDFFRKRVDYFVSAIADAHRDKWIFCLDLFCNKDDFTGAGQTDCYRRIVREKVEAMGRDKVVYVNGLGYPGSPDGLCTDLIHPSAKGCADIGNRLAERMAAYVTVENA